MENKQSPSYYAAVVVINYLGQVLLGKRKEDGIWTTPGGSAEPHELDPAKTASRELFEESGVPADPRFLQPLGTIATRNGKFCHTFLYVAPSGIMTTSNLDPDQEVGTWKWFSMDELPKALKDDPRRFESVRNGYMKFHGIQKSLNRKLGTHSEDCNCIVLDMNDEHCTCSVQKGGKPAQIGEVRTFGGKQYQKMASGDWKLYVHPEEKQLAAEQNKNKVLSLTDKLKQKVAEKKEISHSEKHLADLQSQAVVEGQETRSGKPMFTKIESGLAHGYSPVDFREVGNFFYDRAQKMAENITKLEQTKQNVDPNFEKIKMANLKMAKQFISQAGRVDDRNDKTAASVKKSVVMMGHADSAEINTAHFAIDNQASSHEGQWLERIHNIMDGYQYGDVPRVVALDRGDLYLVKVDQGMYSGIFKTITQVEDGILEDNAKVRLERMTLPSLIQFCVAKEWIEYHKQPEATPVQIESLTTALETPMAQPEAMPVESTVDKKIRILDLLNKLVN